MIKKILNIILKQKIIGYTNFIYELINLQLLKQEFVYIP